MAGQSTPITAAILVGGSSRRMGRPKHDLVLDDGRTMIDFVLEACRCVTDRIVVSGPGDILPDLPHIADRRDGAGPLAGLEAILASGLDERYLLVPCDMPGLRGDDLSRLTECDGDIVVFESESDGMPRSLPAVFHTRVATDLTERIESEDRSLHGFIDRHGPETVPAPPGDRLFNINDIDDLKAWNASRDRG